MARAWRGRLLYGWSWSLRPEDDELVSDLNESFCQNRGIGSVGSTVEFTREVPP
jgi:hypothetical protein